jgi:5'-nucleotidase
MHILLTNDDGVSAPGLAALAQEIRKLGEVSVLAPDHNWSSCGHVKTLHRPLRVRETVLADGSQARETDGAPADCVALALLGFFPGKIDLVVSGINPLANLGQDMTYSGTVTAAMEAVIGGLPGLAVSLNSPDRHTGPLDFSPAAIYAHRIAEQVILHRLPKNVLLNVNVPYLPLDQIRGVRITCQGQRLYRDVLDERKDPRGHPYYWIGGDPPTGVPEEGTDFGALAEGFVSITPLHMDMTAHQAIPELSRWNYLPETPVWQDFRLQILS